MSIEKANEAINEKIIESNGNPFYIEEGGYVKEVLPVIINGKVQLNKTQIRH